MPLEKSTFTDATQAQIALSCQRRRWGLAVGTCNLRNARAERFKASRSDLLRGALKCPAICPQRTAPLIQQRKLASFGNQCWYARQGLLFSGLMSKDERQAPATTRTATLKSPVRGGRRSLHAHLKFTKRSQFPIRKIAAEAVRLIGRCEAVLRRLEHLARAEIMAQPKSKLRSTWLLRSPNQSSVISCGGQDKGTTTTWCWKLPRTETRSRPLTPAISLTSRANLGSQSSLRQTS
jgi:hypothetical protein